MNRAMTEEPPRGARLAWLVGLFARIGVGPGQDTRQNGRRDSSAGSHAPQLDGRQLLKAVIDGSGQLGKRYGQ